METKINTPRGPWPVRYLDYNLPPDSEEIKRRAASAEWYFIKGRWRKCPPYEKPNDDEYFGVDVDRAITLRHLEETWQRSISGQMPPITDLLPDDEPPIDESPIDGFGNVLLFESGTESRRNRLLPTLSCIIGLGFVVGAFMSSEIEVLLPLSGFGAFFLVLPLALKE